MNTLNPITILDGILADWASPKARRLVHSLILLVIAIVTLIFAFGGDWVAALISLGGTLYAATNRANTPAVTLDEAGVDTEGDDDLTYEEAGGLDYPEGEDDFAGEPLYGTQAALYQPGSDAEGFGGDAPLAGPETGSQRL